MYDERKNFSIRDLVLEILLVVLFVFIMIWLFPTKSYLNDNYVTKDEIQDVLIQQLQVVYGRIFADNVESMRDAAKAYFTTERLPKEIGDSVTLTLGEMVSKKLVLDFVDSNGNKCSSTESYVKITKMENEYQLKVQLTCSDYADYIIEYIGCYDYCDTCKEPEKTTTTKPSSSTKPSTSTKPVVSKKYRYQYRLVTQNEYSAWSSWSAWTTTKITANNLTQVETETRKEITGYTKSQQIIGYRTETYTDYVEETYTDYETRTEWVKIGTKRTLTSSVDPTYSNGSYGAWYDAGTKTTYDQVLYSTDTVRYTLTSTQRQLDCNNACKYVTVRYYKVEKRNWNQGAASCPSGYTLEGSKCNKYVTEDVYGWQTRKVAVTKTRMVPVTRTRQVPEYGYVDGDPIYKSVTYYRFRTRKQTSFAGVTYKWSTSSKDSSLIKQGYVYTGYYEEV